jgi:hypothetical protein
MKPYDDALPEEQNSPYKELLPALQRLYSNAPRSLNTAEQHNIIQRVLLRLNNYENLADDAPLSQGGRPTATPASIPLFAQFKRHPRTTRLLGVLAAVVVVIFIASSALLVFRALPTTTGATTSQQHAASTTIHLANGNLGVTLNITPGPYFVNEMIEATMTLTNHTRSTLESYRPCLVGFTFQGSQAPFDHYFDNSHNTNSKSPFVLSDTYCSFAHIGPGQSFTSTLYTTIPISGNVTVQTGVNIPALNAKNSANDSLSFINPGPSLAINVASATPAKRQITLIRRVNAQHHASIIVNAPAPAVPHLLYGFNMLCSDTPDPQNSISVGWLPLGGTTLQEPMCNAKGVQWNYEVGAPGYITANGNYNA